MSTHPKDMDEIIKTIEECKLFNDLFSNNIPMCQLKIVKKLEMYLLIHPLI